MSTCLIQTPSILSPGNTHTHAPQLIHSHCLYPLSHLPSLTHHVPIHNSLSPWPPPTSPLSLPTLKTLNLTPDTSSAAPSSYSPPPPPRLPPSFPAPPRPGRRPPAGSRCPVTDLVFMGFSVCPSYFCSDRPIGSDLAACPDSEPIGRVVFGLHGKILPQTVANFKTMCNSSAYKWTLVHKIFQGQVFVDGRQGRIDKGEVQPPPNIMGNMEVVDPKAFQLKHSRPETLSLCLSENDDYD